MSHLAATIDILLDEYEKKPADLSKVSKIPQAVISRWRSGDQVWISHEDIEKLALAFGSADRKKIHATLLRAHLLDEAQGRTDLVTVEILPEILGGQAIPKSKGPLPHPLPPKLDHAMKVINERLLNDKDIQHHILSLANLLEKGTLS